MAKLELSDQRLEFIKKAEEYYNALRTNIQLRYRLSDLVKENQLHQPILLGPLLVLVTKHC